MRITLSSLTLFIISSITAQAQSPILPIPQQLRAYVTGYNTVPEQTSPTPCIAASGDNICGRTDVVACPRRISLGSFLQIRGATYICEDRLAKKYDSRFDISCDKDFACPPQVTGWADIKVYDPNPHPAAAPPIAVAAASAPRNVIASAASTAIRMAAATSSRRMFVPVRHIAVLRGRFPHRA